MAQQPNVVMSDQDYDVISILYHSLQAAETCQKYLEDASGDSEVRQFIEQVCNDNLRNAEQAKKLLGSRMCTHAGA